jgi:hypothetical protein
LAHYDGPSRSFPSDLLKFRDFCHSWAPEVKRREEHLLPQQSYFRVSTAHIQHQMSKQSPVAALRIDDILSIVFRSTYAKRVCLLRANFVKVIRGHFVSMNIG